MRTYTYQVDRVDQELKGNRGYLMGQPPEISEETQETKTREMYAVEIEVPSMHTTVIEQRAAARRVEKDQELYGNRGYIIGGISPEKEIYMPQESQAGITRLGGFQQQSMPQVIYSEPVSSESKETAVESAFYVVEKGDTLQKISNKFFGTTKKWKKIYEANRNILKSPDKIRPGQRLVIPRD
jgi:LysM repeat protein